MGGDCGIYGSAMGNRRPDPRVRDPRVRKEGNTWQYKSNQDRIDKDAANLNDAAKRDTDAISKSMKDKDHGCKKSYDAVAKELREMDWNKFIQDTIDKGLKK